ncbi:heavy metal-responsive transcriptional regulator [Segeticoccus rhizosphaerae]|uniref:heavy metal-responsive transcriptional regulator n=1 Tax=Segeticoccus rhizosphaerae TaxID=1104777 RepID=UPI0010BF88C3|nr:heavy metal-responsive transcriptional regulator [Ornithinicoccus soli]
MLIGELGEAVRLPSQTIRFYERKGLLPEPSRAANGYRDYDESTIIRVRFIRAAQAAGLTLVEIRSIIDLRDDGHVPCAHVTTLIDGKLADVRRRISELATWQTELEQLRDRSQRLDPADCSDADICHILSTAARPPQAADRSRPQPGHAGTGA